MLKLKEHEIHELHVKARDPWCRAKNERRPFPPSGYHLLKEATSARRFFIALTWICQLLLDPGNMLLSKQQTTTRLAWGAPRGRHVRDSTLRSCVV